MGQRVEVVCGDSGFDPGLNQIEGVQHEATGLVETTDVAGAIPAVGTEGGSRGLVVVDARRDGEARETERRADGDDVDPERIQRRLCRRRCAADGIYGAGNIPKPDPDPDGRPVPS